MLYLNISQKSSFIPAIRNLTLTNVVFEFIIIFVYFQDKFYLTLTNVVFELSKKLSFFCFYCNLTLTNVVFEYKIIF